MGCNQSQSDNKPVKVNIKVTKSVKDPNLNKNDYMVKGITTNSLIIKDSGSIVSSLNIAKLKMLIDMFHVN